MINRIKEIQVKKDQIKKLNNIISRLPEGELSIGHQDNSSKWFCTKDNQQTYIKKADIQFAKDLALKKYLKLKVNVLQSQVNSLNHTIRNELLAQRKLSHILEDPAYLELLSDYLSQCDLEYKEWMNSNYPRNMSHPENLIHQTIAGLLVRSKSESLIAVALSENKIPFRYENLTEIDGEIFAPDFTIINPKTNSIIYWEHFGLIDNEKYLNSFVYKIKHYAKANIILGDNLIATFETKDNPLSYTTINNIINQYFI